MQLESEKYYKATLDIYLSKSDSESAGVILYKGEVYEVESIIYIETRGISVNIKFVRHDSEYEVIKRAGNSFFIPLELFKVSFEKLEQ